MPKGFSGQTAERFIKNTNEALHRAGEVHAKPPHTTPPPPGINMPKFQEPINQKPPFQPEEANPFTDKYITGVGNSSNIIVEQSVYEDCVKKIEITDDTIGREIYNMCHTIEEMCKSIYILPETIPGIMAITQRLKDCLPKFREITEEVNIQIRKYINEIGDIDQAPNGFKVVVTDDGAEHIIDTTKDTLNKQLQNMQNTADSFAQAAESLRNQAGSFGRQANTTKNEVRTLETRIDTLEQREAMQAAAGIANPFRIR